MAPPDPSPIPMPLDPVAALTQRRTAHRFDPSRPLADDLLRRLLDLASLAPLPLPLQPARFILVRSERTRRRLRQRCTFGDARLTEAPAVVVILGYLDPPRTDLEPLIAEQLARGAITADAARRLHATGARTWRDLGDPSLAATRAGMMAAMTLIHAATGLGLATAWVEVFDREKLRDLLGVPDDHAVAALVALGYPLDPAPPFPGRLPLDRVTYLDHFGQPWPLLAPPPDADPGD